jgi:hypothetical protein
VLEQNLLVVEQRLLLWKAREGILDSEGAAEKAIADAPVDGLHSIGHVGLASLGAVDFALDESKPQGIALVGVMHLYASKLGIANSSFPLGPCQANGLVTLVLALQLA